MSYIFHEPLEPAVYARRTVGPPAPPATRAFGQHVRAVVSLESSDIWREETESWVNQRRAFAPLVARRSFSGAGRFAELDLFTEEPVQSTRRAFAPVKVAARFSGANRFYELDLFSEEVGSTQRRAFAPPVVVIPAASFSGALRFSEIDLFSEEIPPTQRRAYAPVVARRSFGRAAGFYGLDLFSDDVQPSHRRAYAPLRIVSAATVPVNPAKRLLASLLASGAYDEFYPTQRTTRFVVGYAPITGDVGLSASFTFTDSGTSADATLSFSGKGDDPTQPTGLQALSLEGLQALPLEIVQVTPGSDGYSGKSASKIV